MLSSALAARRGVSLGIRLRLLARPAAAALSSQPEASNFIVDHRDNGLTIVSLNRPEGKNSMSKAMIAEMNVLMEELKEDTMIRAVVLTSAVPKVFCAGADLKERKLMNIDEIGDFVTGLRTTFALWASLPMPTIAAIEGVALGGGLELAMCCDIRVAGEKALLGLPETALAIIPGAGGTQRLPRIIGVAKAKELIFTGRRFNGREAEKMGVVNECVEAGSADSRAVEIAEEICKNGPIATRMAKASIDGGLQVDLETGLLIEKACYGEVIYTDDRTEGLTAFGEKRTPEYKGR
jgi:methylglutaconyl-CoA hydratase